MKRSYSIKVRRFLDKYLDGASLADCAEYAGYSGKDRNVLANQGYQVLKSIDLSMEEICDLAGLTDSYLVQKTLEGLEARKVELATFRGKILDEKSFPDYPTRSKYLEISARLKGLFVDKTELTGRDGGEITLTIVSPTAKSKRALSLDL